MTALRTTTSPLDRLTETELRNTVATWSGISYDNLATATQTELNRILEEAHEYISKRMAHYPWAVREKEETLSASSQTISMPADFRSMRQITETQGGKTKLVQITTKADFVASWGTQGRSTHPWAESAAEPRWFFDGMTSDDPPVAQWKRAKSDSSAITVTFYYTPYFGLISSDTFVELPASAYPEIRHEMRAEYAALRREYDVAREERGLREEKIQASNIADNRHGAADLDIVPEPSVDWSLEMGGP